MSKKRIKFMTKIMDETGMSQGDVARHLEMYQQGVSLMLNDHQNIYIHHLVMLDTLRDKPIGVQKIKDRFNA